MRSPTAGIAPRVSRAASITAAVGILVVVVHILMTVVYNVPTRDARSELPLAAPAEAYMRPYFVQDYRIFAPNPAHTDNQLWLRAWVELPDGERVESAWVNATDVELAATYRKVLRKQLTVVGAERMMSAHRALTDEQREVAAGNFHRDTDLTRLQDALRAEPPDNVAAVRPFIQATNYVTSYATQAAYALWGDDGDILAVQTRVVFDPVVRWDDRLDPDATRPAASYTDLGWRPLLEWPGQNREAFARTFAAWAEQAGVEADVTHEGDDPGDRAAVSGGGEGAGGDE